MVRNLQDFPWFSNSSEMMMLIKLISRCRRRALGEGRPGRAEAAFTLVELMAVVAIVAVLGAVAIPVLTRDDIGGRFKRAVRQVSQDLQRARYEALSNREHRAIDVLASLHDYQLQAAVPGLTTRSLLTRRQLEQRIELYAATTDAAHPDNASATIPTAPPGSTENLPFEIQFTSTSEVWAKQHSPGSAVLEPSDATAVTLWLRALDANNKPMHRARIVISGATGYTRIYGETLNASGGVVSRW